MKKTLLFSSLFTFLFVFSPNTYAQNETSELIKTGQIRSQFHYTDNGKARIKYLEFDEFIIRLEENVISFFDESLKQVDQISLPEDSENITYSIDQDDNYLYIIQKRKFGEYRDATYKYAFYKVNLYDFSNYETSELESQEPFSLVTLLLFKGNAIIALTGKTGLSELQISKPNNKYLEKVDFKKYENEACEGGRWGGPMIMDGSLRCYVYKQDGELKSTSQILFFDKNLKVIKEHLAETNLETREVIITDENGDEVITDISMKSAFANPLPYPINVNGEKIWVKTTYKVKGFIPKIEATWVSRDSANNYINLTEHLKNEMKSTGVKKSTGMNAPVIYADPINNSIIIQYWLVADVQLNGIGGVVQSFVYFNLDSQFNLRATYKIKMDRYPLGDPISQQMTAQYDQISGTNQNITFVINKNPKKWKGVTIGTTQNAFDYLFSQERTKGLCTIINANNSQYLFIDREDGSTTGYIFKK